jgi:hypothetical protein
MWLRVELGKTQEGTTLADETTVSCNWWGAQLGMIQRPLIL